MLQLRSNSCCIIQVFDQKRHCVCCFISIDVIASGDASAMLWLCSVFQLHVVRVSNSSFLYYFSSIFLLFRLTFFIGSKIRWSPVESIQQTVILTSFDGSNVMFSNSGISGTAKRKINKIIFCFISIFFDSFSPSRFFLMS